MGASVSSGVDSFGTFGEAGQDLPGLAFTVTFTTDDASPGAYVYQDEFRTQILSGPAIDQGDAATYAVVSINGQDLTIGGQIGGIQMRYQQLPNVLLQQAEGPLGHIFLQVWSNANPLTGTPSFSDAFDVSLGELDNVTAYFNVYALNPETNQLEYAHIRLTPTRVTNEVLSDPAAAPEPSAWLLMIGGFALAGAALRRRREMRTA